MNIMQPLKERIDYRLGGAARYYLAREGDSLMRIPEEIRKCVAFIAYKREEKFKAAGTGFFLTVAGERCPDYRAIYLVTAEHVIRRIGEKSDDQKAWVRLNRRDGSSEGEGTDLKDWVFHSLGGAVDAAVLHWEPSYDRYDYRAIPGEKMAVTEGLVQTERIGPGDDIFLAGLFIGHVGKQRNLPIVRVGNIALMPEEPIEDRDFGPVEVYLVECRSVGGLSGSPVFVSVGGARAGRLRDDIFYWLGLVRGHGALPRAGAVAAADKDLAGEPINTGIALVTPATKVLEILGQEDLVKARREQEEEYLYGQQATEG